MLALTLPRAAFIPRHPLSDQERYDFVMRRDRLFTLCTADEQRWLLAAAAWYGAHDPLLLPKPNVFTESAMAMFNRRFLRGLHPGRPRVSARILATVSDAIYKIEGWRSDRLEEQFIAYLVAIQEQGAADDLLGVVHFLRVLPVRPGGRNVPHLEQQLGALAASCAQDARVPIARRFAAAKRCKLWPRDVTGWMNTPRDLDLLVWRLLLELCTENFDAALEVIDAHWGSKQPSELLSAFTLREDPQLASQLAMKLRPYRVNFAAEMLGRSIWDASFQISRLDAESGTKLQQVIDASCAILANWTRPEVELDVPATLVALKRLFQFGNPSQAYWRDLPRRSMALLQRLPAPEHVDHLSLLACVVFYTEQEDRLGDEALKLLAAATLRILSPVEEWLEESADLRERPHSEVLFSSLQSDVSRICGSILSLLEDKTLAKRNRRVPSCPDHPLLHMVELATDRMLARVIDAEPQHALEHYAIVVRGLSHETLVRKHHRLLREQFADRARAFPQDAGLALAHVVRYCGYSQVDDEMYKKNLCRQTFDVLLPVLDEISPSDATVARKGIGWSPRRNS